jgi:hypothetical protein
MDEEESPKVIQEPDCSEVRNDPGSQSVCSATAAENEQKEPEKSEPLEHPTRTTPSDSESRSEQDVIQQASATLGQVGEVLDRSVRGEDSPKHIGSLPVVLSARAYGLTFTKKNGQTGGSVMFRLPWRQIRTASSTRKVNQFQNPEVPIES